MEQAPHSPRHPEDTQGVQPSRAELQEARAAVDQWQQRLLPTMIKVVLGLALFFFIASFAQLLFLQWNVLHNPATRIDQAIAAIPILNSDESINGQTVQLRVAAAQEADLADRRYHMARSMLLAQLWIRYLGFITGMIVAVIGAIFILGKLREGRAEFSAEAVRVKFSLISASPGLILAIVGSSLMIVTLLAQQETQISDAALFMPTANLEANAVTSPGTISLPATMPDAE